MQSLPAASALYFVYCLVWPQALLRIARFRPRFWATFLPGLSTVPAALFVMFLTFRASKTKSRLSELTSARLVW